MPSIAWFPAAIVLFGLERVARSSSSIVLGAAPSIANGFISRRRQHPADPPAGRPRARRQGLVVVPPRRAAGRAARRSSAGSSRAGRSPGAACSPVSCIVLIAGKAVARSGARQGARDLNDYPAMYATMIVILIIGIVVDALVFGTAERWIRRRYGLIDAARVADPRLRRSRSRSSTTTVFITSPTCGRLARRPCPRSRSRTGCSPCVSLRGAVVDA